MVDLNLSYNGNELPAEITQQMIDYAKNELNVPPSFLIVKLHYEGLWGDSGTAQANNNWSGMTWNSSWSEPYTRPSGVVVTRGTPRPAIEGGYYIKYDTVQNFLKDWCYLIRLGGVYNVGNSDTFEDAVKGMFIYGGAQYDYATMNTTGSKRRFELYYAGMSARRTAINNANNGILDELDSGDYSSDPEESPPKYGYEFETIVNNINSIINTMKQNFSDFEQEIYDLAKNLMSGNMFDYGNSEILGNKNFKVTKVLNNMYQVKPSVNVDMKLLETIGETNNQLEEIQKELENLEKSADESNPNDGASSTGKPLYPTVIEGTYITSGYGWRTHPVHGDKRFHGSIDIGSGGRHVDIFATQDGTVTLNQWSDTAGWMVIIEHTADPYYSRYIHMHEQSPVSVGTTVKKGDTIGTMGTTGTSTGIHLDFAISTNGVFGNENDTIDPEEYLQMTF